MTGRCPARFFVNEKSLSSCLPTLGLRRLTQPYLLARSRRHFLGIYERHFPNPFQCYLICGFDIDCSRALFPFWKYLKVFQVAFWNKRSTCANDYKLSKTLKRRSSFYNNQFML